MNPADVSEKYFASVRARDAMLVSTGVALPKLPEVSTGTVKISTPRLHLRGNDGVIA